MNEKTRKLLKKILGPLLGFIARKWLASDPWDKSAVELSEKKSRTFFGSGCVKEWSWYFEGESSIRVKKIKDVCQWLRRCEYVHDKELFNESDFWQHPTTFENLRKGDCEDHAIWAWRKLTELGLDAELVGGTIKESGFRNRHAWVHFQYDGTEYLMETTTKGSEPMYLPIEEAKKNYLPECSVNSKFETFYFGGFGTALAERLND